MGIKLKYSIPGLGNEIDQARQDKKNAEAAIADNAAVPDAPKPKKRGSALISDAEYERRRTRRLTAASRNKSGGRQSTILTTSDKLGG